MRLFSSLNKEHGFLHRLHVCQPEEKPKTHNRTSQEEEAVQNQRRFDQREAHHHHHRRGHYFQQYFGLPCCSHPGLYSSLRLISDDLIVTRPILELIKSLLVVWRVFKHVFGELREALHAPALEHTRSGLGASSHGPVSIQTHRSWRQQQVVPERRVYDVKVMHGLEQTKSKRLTTYKSTPKQILNKNKNKNWKNLSSVIQHLARRFAKLLPRLYCNHHNYNIHFKFISA